MNTFNDMEKLVEKWELTGLLIDCKDLSEKIQLSEILEDMANYLFNKYDTLDMSDYDMTKAGILIPLCVRIFYNGVTDINIDKLVDVVDTLFPKLKQMGDDSYNRIDGEAEFTLLCADTYIKEYKNG